ncbi:glutathione S-transferase family protein [Roseomonas sp. HJA6]|uniref:Glutathione S-transferase family protein n=1 Tax=Roseomonas alba TaxID=2846776 RepID=A0ABS7AH76_9PROT|nr:glutathione S-transferase family protein [Neoroseomonas alba]MBW6401658.1 glutathione S-transferase family protein [Neoroseomonas alba]
MPITLYDLAGADPARRFSPYCWRARLALAQKGLDVETIPWRFTERSAIGVLGSEKVPVIVDGDHVQNESWQIAEYLEATYPDRPSLFGGAGGHALARFLTGWADAVVLAGIAGLIVSDIPAILAPDDAAYFVESREKRYRKTLAEVTAGRETRVTAFREALLPLRLALRQGPFLHGEAPGYGDAIVFGGFQWARCCSPFPILEASDPVHAWRERMLDAYDGLGRSAPGFA